MKLLNLIMREKIEVPCTVEISNTFDQLGAHVRFDDGTIVYPGDEVLVHGAPVAVPYGQCESFARKATITRASGLERAWTRATGDFEFMELCEFSFSERAAL
jgi:hypothetical protein